MQHAPPLSKRRECFDRAGLQPASNHHHALARLTSWFEFHAGSRLVHLCFPFRYRQMARDGIPVLFKSPGPTMKGKQPIIANVGIRAKTREKIGKVIKRRFLLTTDLPIKSFIKFFAVPKGNGSYNRYTENSYSSAEQWTAPYFARAAPLHHNHPNRPKTRCGISFNSLIIWPPRKMPCSHITQATWY